MAEVQRTPGRHVTRRLEEPRLTPSTNRPSESAQRLAGAHNDAVRQYGSNSGGFHTYNPDALATAGVHDGAGGFPDGTVVSPLAWGVISDRLAQRLLEQDGVA